MRLLWGPPHSCEYSLSHCSTLLSVAMIKHYTPKPLEGYILPYRLLCITEENRRRYSWQEFEAETSRGMLLTSLLPQALSAAFLT